jgi:hypothetical protein
MRVTAVVDQGTHLLIADGSRYAVIERRDGHFFNCHGGSRDGIDDLADVGRILDAGDWMNEATARTTFEEIVARGNQLAQGIR